MLFWRSLISKRFSNGKSLFVRKRNYKHACRINANIKYLPIF
jgi:hypothetical protein